jgi:type 1 fimbria pilin
MNRSVKKISFAAQLLSVFWAVSALSAHAQNGVLEIHGVLTSPGCSVNPHNVAMVNTQTQINGLVCGLTNGTGNPLSNLNIARISEENLQNANGRDSGKRMVTLTYR